jgi:hypothetical protein
MGLEFTAIQRMEMQQSVCKGVTLQDHPCPNPTLAEENAASWQ